MTKTKLVGGIMAVVVTAAGITGIAAANATSEQAYAKSVPTATDGPTEPSAQQVGEVPAKKKAPRLPTLLRKNTKGDDHRGFEKSAYRGKFFHKGDEPLRKCIISRESHATYMLSDGGAYQFMSYDAWPVSLTWMMKKETRKVYGNKKANIMQDILSKKELHYWSRYWQDKAFYTVLNYKHRHSGIKHWAATVPGTDCF